MMAPVIDKKTIGFLKALSKNNNREWFNTNKLVYLTANENMIAFTEALLVEMRKHDHLETASGKDALMRIYRDTRFSKDKTPYKSHFGGGFRRATKRLRGGYYFQIGPGESLAAGGFFSPAPTDLLRIRKDIDMNYVDWKKMLAGKGIVKTFDTLKGEKIITSPKGFSRDNPAVDLLNHKQFYLERNFTDEEVLDKNFLKELNQTFKNLRPYFDFMSEVLTTNLNGESVID